MGWLEKAPAPPNLKPLCACLGLTLCSANPVIVAIFHSPKGSGCTFLHATRHPPPRYRRRRASQIFPLVSARLNSSPPSVIDNPTFPGLPMPVKDCCV